MKKNTMMRIASVLMIAVLLTTCVISGTFAKYTTTGAAANDSARVAKWGVTITPDANTDNTFTQTYAKDSTTSFDNTVVAGVDVVAPGTSGALANVDIEGTPEVAVKITYVADLVLTGWEVGGAVYCPIVITVNGTDYKVGDAGIADTAALESKVEEVIAGLAAEYAAGTDLASTDVADDVAISWAWAYTGDDVKDTALGDATTAATIEITVTTTVTQID